MKQFIYQIENKSMQEDLKKLTKNIDALLGNYIYSKEIPNKEGIKHYQFNRYLTMFEIPELIVSNLLPFYEMDKDILEFIYNKEIKEQNINILRNKFSINIKRNLSEFKLDENYESELKEMSNKIKTIHSLGLSKSTTAYLVETYIREYFNYNIKPNRRNCVYLTLDDEIDRLKYILTIKHIKHISEEMTEYTIDVKRLNY